ncbi:MAG: putative glycoside hydrolase [candidate division KSB1 bacterium]|nr:putative glycoside hydrolase [candidate division KSB1 bacterium]
MRKTTVLIASIVLNFAFSYAQVDHRYPRLGIHQWGGAVDEWYAQFDLISTALIDVEWAKRIKRLNPDVLILPTSDWNNGTYIEPFPDEWYIRRADGSRIEYGGPNTFYANLSDLCPKSPLYGGKRVCDYLPELLMKRVDLTVFDGIATDGLYYQDKELWNYHVVSDNLGWDTDLDQNGVNDFNEHGEEWVVGHWNAGVDILFQKLRQLMPANKLLMVNSGSWHYHHHAETNGVFLEHSYGGVTWSWFTYIYDRFMQSLRKPNTIFLDYDGDSKNEFRDMRFQLATTLYGNGYFSYSDPGSHEHYYNKFYDEFLVDLGYPKGPMQQIGSTGVWVRFFDHGAAIVNVSGALQLVRDEDLKTVAGYEGPYYRFRGGQDPAHNNGQLFDNIQLWGGKDNSGTIGDGYLLLKTPKTIVYSIIIDNVDMGTSPGTPAPEFIGRWEQYPDPIPGNPYYTMRVADWFGMFAYAYTSPGNGESKVIYRPTIGVPGYYQVFEWHCWHESAIDDEATNVPYTIKYHNGQKSGMINQKKDHGRWNSLGLYYFEAGTSGYLEFTNKADGVVIADAVKFEYRGDNPNADITPPDPPQGVKVMKGNN